MKLVLCHVSSARESWAETAVEGFVQKINPFFPMTDQALKPKKAGREDAQFKKEAESNVILEFIKPDDYVIVFDEHGEALDSRGFAKRIEIGLGSSKKRMIFVIGGAYGMTEALLQRADRKISLSAMTFNHVLARTVAYEQIYRALTIIRNIPYHND